MARFVVAIEHATAEMRTAFTTYFEQKGYEQWHWFQNIWLLANVPEDVTPELLREELKALSDSKCHLLIFRMPPGDIKETAWSVKDSHPWLQTHWRKEKPSGT